jgi:hypothetical protein
MFFSAKKNKNKTSSRLGVCGLGGQPHISSLAFIFFIQWVDMYFFIFEKN